MSANPYTFSDNKRASQWTNTIDTRLSDRYVPSQLLQPYLSVRPVLTKYSIMPIIDPRKPSSVPMVQQPVYNTSHVFNPGNRNAPWSGFASNINVESELRNQIYALQKCNNAIYVPNSTSDLYKYTFQPDKSANQVQPYPALFKTDHLEPFDPNPEKFGGGLFNNCTRQQLKELSDKPADCSKPTPKPNLNKAILGTQKQQPK